MTLLHIYKSQPDELTRSLVDLVSKNNDTKEFILYDEKADYEKLVDQIFECDKITCWW